MKTDNLKAQIGYIVTTLSLGLMLTACGEDQNGYGSANFMNIQDGSRELVSDTNQASFLACGTDSGGYQNGSYPYSNDPYANYNNPYQYPSQNNHSSSFRIEYQQSSNHTQQNHPGPTNDPNAYYDGAYNPNHSWTNPPYGNSSGYEYNQHNQYPYPSGQGVRVSLTISRTQNHQQSGYYVSSLQTMGIPSQPMGSQACSVSNVSENQNTISATVDCDSGPQSGRLRISFSCQKR